MRFFKVYSASFFVWLFPLMGIAQPGQIIETGDQVLDPNQDGFISLTNAGFSGDIYDVDEFELSMFGIPIIGDGEAIGDNQSGPLCGITDLALDTAGYALYAAFDANENLIFRFRLSDNSSSVQSYSILIDTDGAVGPDDPNSSSDNPGFEIAITLIQKFGVYLYDIDGISSCPTALESYDDATHQQKAISAQNTCDNQDIYIDFYLPFADLTTHFGITPSSNLRFIGVTNISATCALDGSISDIGGVDDRDYDGCFSCAVLDLTTNQCPTSIDQLCATCDGFPSGFTATPLINQPLLVGDASINGLGAPTSEIYIELFSSAGLLIDRDTTITNPDSVWMSGNFLRPLEIGDSIVVNAYMQGMCLSGQNDAGLSFAIVDPNQAPVLSGSQQTINYPATGPPVFIFEDLAITDDNNNLVSARVELSQNYEIGADFLEAGAPASITVSYSPTQGVLELLGTASISDYQAVIRSIAFYNSNANPSLEIREVTLYVNDGTSSSAPLRKNIIIIPINELPVVTGATDTLIYNEGDGQVKLDNFINISDADGNDLVTATITFTAGFDAGDDSLAFTTTNDIDANFSDSTLTLIGTTTLNKYQNALRNVTFENKSSAPTSLVKTVQIVVNDGTANSLPFNRIIKIIPIVEPPEIAVFLGGGTNDTLQYIEGEGVKPIIPELVVQDADDIDLDGFTARFTKNYFQGEDSLVIEPDFGVTATYDQQSGTLAAVGRTSLANYQNILRTLSYSNSNEDPQIDQRSIEIFAYDGDSNSNSLFIAIDVIPVNDPPILTGAETSINYPESSGPMLIAEAIEASDLDDSLLVSASVRITDNFTFPEDILSFSEVAGVSGSYNPGSGELSFTGQAKVSDYQSVLQSISYENTQAIANKLSRIIIFTVSDGEQLSNEYQVEVVLEEVVDPVIIYQLVTPDGDGSNDVWLIDGILQYPDNEIKLFNRWNNLVFETTGYDNETITWSGQGNTGFSTGALPDGTYFYTVDLKDGSVLREGFLVLKRK